MSKVVMRMLFLCGVIKRRLRLILLASALGLS